MEDELLNEELGLAMKKRRVGYQQLDTAEIKLLLARGESTRERTDVERVEGLGAAPAKRHDHVPKMSLVEQEIARREGRGEGLLQAYESNVLQPQRYPERPEKVSFVPGALCSLALLTMGILWVLPQMLGGAQTGQEGKEREEGT